MFSVEPHSIGRFACHRLINQTTGEYVEILTEFGAGINDLVIKNKNGQLISVIDGYRTSSEIVNLHHTKYKGCKLSPFPNRIASGKYNYNQLEHQLAINEVSRNNQLHGLLHFRPFHVVEQNSSEKSALLVLVYDYKGTDQGYPFPFLMRINFELKAGELTIDTQIENTDNTSLPLGDGWHPYFKFDGGLDTIQLKMDEAKRVSSGFDNKLNVSHGFENFAAIGSIKMDDCFEIVSKKAVFELILKDSTNGQMINVWQACGVGEYKYLQIYTPDSRREIAIEPVSCPPNAFNTKEGLIELAPGEKHSISMGIKYDVF